MAEEPVKLRAASNGKRLFVEGESWEDTVVLNWHGTPEEEFTYLANAFHRVAKDALRARKRDPARFRGMYQFHAYPIVYLYRHALELHLKAVVLTGAPMLELRGQTPMTKQRVLSTHKLRDLTPEVERVVKACGFRWNLGNKSFRNVALFDG